MVTETLSKCSNLPESAVSDDKSPPAETTIEIMKSADIIKQNPSVIPTAAKASTTEESSEKLESDNLPRGGAVQPESIVKITPSRPQLVTMKKRPLPDSLRATPHERETIRIDGMLQRSKKRRRLEDDAETIQHDPKALSNDEGSLCKKSPTGPPFVTPVSKIKYETIKKRLVNTEPSKCLKMTLFPFRSPTTVYSKTNDEKPFNFVLDSLKKDSPSPLLSKEVSRKNIFQPFILSTAANVEDKLSELPVSDEDESPSMSPFPKQSKLVLVDNDYQDSSITDLEVIVSKNNTVVDQESGISQQLCIHGEEKENCLCALKSIRSNGMSERVHRLSSSNVISSKADFKSFRLSPVDSLATSNEDEEDSVELTGGNPLACLDTTADWAGVNDAKGLVYSGSMDASVVDNYEASNDVPFMSPLGLRKILSCNESLQSPFMSKPNPQMKLNTPNVLCELEPIRSSPLAPSYTFKAQDNFTLNEDFLSLAEDSVSSNSASFFQSIEQESDTESYITEPNDFNQYFRLLSCHSEFEEEEPSRKCLEFICQLHEIPPPKNDGLVSPYDSQLRIYHISQSPTKEELNFQSREMRDEFALRNELWSAWINIEKKYMATPSYFCYQNLTTKGRIILVNWLMEISADLCLHRQTFQVALNYFDRFYSKTKKIPIVFHQIIAAASLFIASKKEENESPKISKIVELCSSPGLTLPQFSAIERKIMEVLDWELTPPSCSDWLCLYLRSAALDDPAVFSSDYMSGDDVDDGTGEGTKRDLKFDIRIFNKAINLIDIYVHYEDSLVYPASVISAAALFVTLVEELHFAKDECENELKARQVLLQCTRYSYEEIECCIYYLNEYVLPTKYNGVVNMDGSHSEALIQMICPPVRERIKPADLRLDTVLRFYFQTEYNDLPNYMNRGFPGSARC